MRDNARMPTSTLAELGEARLRQWASCRAMVFETAGWCGVSTTESMRRAAQGGSPSTRPHRLTLVEAQCDRQSETFRVEAAVQALQRNHRRAVVAVYLREISTNAYAKSLKIPYSQAQTLLREAAETVERDVRYQENCDRKQQDNRKKLLDRKLKLAKVAKFTKNSVTGGFVGGASSLSEPPPISTT